MTMSGRAIVEAAIDGDRDSDASADLALGKEHRKVAILGRASTA